jgi:hypothetical protein
MNKVERDFQRLKSEFVDKYDMTKLYNDEPLEQLGPIPHDISEALEYWFKVRIRKTNPSDELEIVTSNMIKSEIIKDLGIPLPHDVIGKYMTFLIGEENVVSASSGIVPWEMRYMFDNIEIVPLEECSVMKIFIAQPMSGIPDEEVEQIRKQITDTMIEKYGKNVEIIDQFHIPEDELPGDDLRNPRIHKLGRSIQFLADADLVVFAGDFLHTKGCCVELAVCKEYDIPFIIYNKEEI